MAFEPAWSAFYVESARLRLQRTSSSTAKSCRSAASKWRRRRGPGREKAQIIELRRDDWRRSLGRSRSPLARPRCIILHWRSSGLRTRARNFPFRGVETRTTATTIAAALPTAPRFFRKWKALPQENPMNTARNFSKKKKGGKNNEIIAIGRPVRVDHTNLAILHRSHARTHSAGHRYYYITLS